MTKPTPAHPRLVSLTCIAVLVVLATAAARAPRPNPLFISGERPLRTKTELPSPVAPSPALTDSAPRNALTAPVKAQTPRVNKVSRPKVAPAALTAISGAADSLTLDEIHGMIAAHHPSALTGDPNANTITLVVDTRMRYVVSMAEARELRSSLMERPRGPGRSGGVETRALAGGGSPGPRARGSINGTNTPPDSVTGAYVAELRARMPADSAVKGELRIVGSDVFMHRGRNASETSSESTAADLSRRLGEMLRINTTALAALIDLRNVESIRGRTFEAGELGTTTLRVFVVRMMP